MVSEPLKFFLCWSKFSRFSQICARPRSHSMCLASVTFASYNIRALFVVLVHPLLSQLRPSPPWFSRIYRCRLHHHLCSFNVVEFDLSPLGSYFSLLGLYFSPLGLFFILRWSTAFQHVASRVRGAYKNLLLLDPSESRPVWSIRISPRLSWNLFRFHPLIWCLIHLDFAFSPDSSGSCPAWFIWISPSRLTLLNLALPDPFGYRHMKLVVLSEI